VTESPPEIVAELQYLTNGLGDVYARVVDGQEEPVNPDDWGWLAGTHEKRRPLEDLQALPGYTVLVTADPELRWIPGPRPGRSRGIFKWAAGAAPAAVAMSKAGAADGASGQYGRLSDALAWATDALPRNPQSRPFHVLDLLEGRRIVIDYEPVITLGGAGSVYIVEDGIGVKIGHTAGPVALRVASLQTGNPRLISTIATVTDAGLEVEAYLHNAFAQWAMQGEWFDRSHLMAEARIAKGWGHLIRLRLPSGDWNINVHPPYG
jgi:hypothetical protein